MDLMDFIILHLIAFMMRQNIFGRQPKIQRRA